VKAPASTIKPMQILLHATSNLNPGLNLSSFEISGPVALVKASLCVIYHYIHLWTGFVSQDWDQKGEKSF